jgi:hypothetical protein
LPKIVEAYWLAAHGASQWKAIQCLDRLHEARKDLRIFDQFGEFQWLLGVVNVAYNKATFIMEERGIGIEEASICTALKISILASQH